MITLLFGRPIKHIRHVNESTLTIEPQRFQVHKCWRFSPSATARTDGLDLTSSGGADMPEGSIVTKHKLEILVTPETIEPQQIYMGRLKLSFADVMSFAICGGRFNQATYQDTSTEDFDVITNAITPTLWSDDASATKITVKGFNVANLEIGGASSGFGITEFHLDDHIKHFLTLKKITVFDQRPLMGERWQRIPSKVKRINEGTFYGIFFFNDSVRGGTPADTQVKINLKEYIEELAI